MRQGLGQASEGTQSKGLGEQAPQREELRHLDSIAGLRMYWDGEGNLRCKKWVRSGLRLSREMKVIGADRNAVR